MGEGFVLHWFRKNIDEVRVALETGNFTADEKEILKDIIRRKEEENK